MDSLLYSAEQYFKDRKFPLVTSYHKQRGTVPHVHDFNELVIVRNGSGRHITENLSYAISAGDVFVMRPHFKHYYSDTNNLELINILYCPEKLNIPQFDLRNIPGYYALFEAEPSLLEKGQFRSRLSLDVEQLADIEKVVSKLYNELRLHQDGYCFTSIAYLMQIISYLSRSYSSHGGRFSQRLLRVSTMMNFIEHNFMHKISLDDIIRKGNMSPSTANRAFRDAMDMTPIDYLMKVRIEYAVRLMKTTTFSIMEIAGKSGFGDSNYFSKQFRRIMGYSPRAYRKQQLSDSTRTN